MENINAYYEVTYVDDFNITHITVAKNQNELRFIRDRFDNVEYTYVTP
jgi:uncharacterized protein YpbB